MSLDQLDAFLAHARQDSDLERSLRNPADPLDLEAFLALAAAAGFAVDENDVIAAQQRAEADLSDAELQRRAGEEARRLRHFIPG
jgi:predicted ribosomally synthesized peptide with nif11-like leader